jgi:heat shock protein HtpX
VETFTARNRARIAALLLASVANYFVTALLAGAALGLALVVWALAKVGEVPTSGDGWKYLGIGTAIVIALGAVVALVASLVALPRARRDLEAGMLSSPALTMVEDASDARRLVNLTDGLAIAAGISPPRLALVDDPAPNAFAIGTRPSKSVIAVTTGLLDDLTRPQVEAVLAYEITQVASLDVALTTWVIALTAQVSSAADLHPVAELATGFTRRFAMRMRAWALRDTAAACDRAAVAVSKNPAALVAALERLADDPRVVAWMAPETAALWIEVPESVARPAGSTTADATLQAFTLHERIAAVRTLASLPPATPTAD